MDCHLEGRTKNKLVNTEMIKTISKRETWKEGDKQGNSDWCNFP